MWKSTQHNIQPENPLYYSREAKQISITYYFTPELLAYYIIEQSDKEAAETLVKKQYPVRYSTILQEAACLSFQRLLDGPVSTRGLKPRARRTIGPLYYYSLGLQDEKPLLAKGACCHLVTWQSSH